jgi:hypothetical protein
MILLKIGKSNGYFRCRSINSFGISSKTVVIIQGGRDLLEVQAKAEEKLTI